GNPAAWSQRRFTADEIRTPGPDNRWIGFPYPKLMNSNNSVEQGAALLLCSVAAAERFGVARDRWVFPHSGADAHDTYALPHRHDLWSSPGMRACGRHTLAAAGIAIDDVAHVDLYSCFPSAVEIAASELGLPVDDPARALTVTGGLTFAGGPWNNYVTHAIATMAERLIEKPGALGLITANGGYLTKHSIGVYGSHPSGTGFRWEDVQSQGDREPRRAAVEEWEGIGTIEAWTAPFDRDGRPEKAFVAVRTPGDARTLAVMTAPSDVEASVTEDIAGAKVAVQADGTAMLG